MAITINKNILIALIGILSIFIAYNLGILGFLLLCSVLANGYFLSKMLKMQDKMENLEADLTTLYYNIDGFSEHLDRINNMHVYHMDDNVIGMIKHSRQILNSLIDFQIEYSTQPVEVIENNEEGEKEFERSETPESVDEA